VFNEETQEWEYDDDGEVEPLTAEEEEFLLEENDVIDESMRDAALALFRMVPPREQDLNENWVPPPPPPPEEDDDSGLPPPPPPPLPAVPQRKIK
jgi:hypothetical protein